MTIKEKRIRKAKIIACTSKEPLSWYRKRIGDIICIYRSNDPEVRLHDISEHVVARINFCDLTFIGVLAELKEREKALVEEGSHI